jgi:quinolinate synthase
MASMLRNRAVCSQVLRSGMRNSVRSFATFPAMRISAGGIASEGSYAQNLADYLTPDKSTVSTLDTQLTKKRMGVVSHYYMDSELQGTLASLEWENVFCADSLAMGQAAVRMAKGGVQSIACLGVDFMSESVRATLDQAGFRDVPVLRCVEEHIGCSLAEAAERPGYLAWLAKAAETPNALHVVYINTSMHSKAMAHHTVPTITCTSSNVVYTILQADVDIPGVNIYYGPDTYMGRNLYSLLTTYSTLPDSEIAKLHPAHSQATLKSLLGRFSYYQQGICVVHHMFGSSVVDTVQKEYPLDGTTFYTAHLEVPGEMFDIAFAAQGTDDGVVGSTSNIKDFIMRKSQEAIAKDLPKVSFILGTESGMITTIVNGAKAALPEGCKTEIEIIFPVSDDAVTATGDEDLALVPGVQGSEGCSTAGGCASCPFMKMNDLDKLMDLVGKVKEDGSMPASLDRQVAKSRGDIKVGDSSVAELGGQPISYMNHLTANRSFPEDLMRLVKRE